jgi:hypothetical protein
VILLGYWAYRGKERAAVAAEKAAVAAQKAEDAVGEIVAVKGSIFALGKQIDGRLSELLKSTAALSHAEGVVEGEKNRSDRDPGR